MSYHGINSVMTLIRIRIKHIMKNVLNKRQRIRTAKESTEGSFHVKPTQKNSDHHGFGRNLVLA